MCFERFRGELIPGGGLTQAFLMVTELELPLKHRQKGKAAPGEERV